MATGTGGPIVEVRGLAMNYGENHVLRGIDFEIARGEVIALLGPNGAGKTTTIEILEGLRRRSAGDVRVLGMDPEQPDDAWRARIGIVIQSWRDHARWTPRTLLAHLGSLYEPFVVASGRNPRVTDELLDLVGLLEHGDKKIRLLSGGQRRRLDVAIGIVGRPELLFLDEPTAGLDPEGRREFHTLIHDLVDGEDTTVLLTTHDLSEADRLADRILILAGGDIVANGSSADLAARLEREAQVSWVAGGERIVHSTPDATGFVRNLLNGPDGSTVEHLEISRPSLEDTYIEMVTRFESGDYAGASRLTKEDS
jgi:ABC-2 type transport system ATP-binding protein